MTATLFGGRHGWYISLAIYAILFWVIGYFGETLSNQEMVPDIKMLALLCGIACPVAFVARQVNK